MNIKTKMYYLGKNAGKSKTSGNEYYIVKMMDENDNQFDWFVPKNDQQDMLTLVAMVEKAKKFHEYQVLLHLSSYQGKARIDLVGMAE